MTLDDPALRTDENVYPEVVAFLRSTGFDVVDVREAELTGKDDFG